MQFKVPVFGHVKFNPIVTFMSLALSWLFVALCIIEKDNMPFSEWKSDLTANFTWLYVGCFGVAYGIFVTVIYFR